jgi:glycosyltransferase involved in cell wall biosynthesis
VEILWGSPLPPTRSGVSDYAVELLGELGSRARVRVLEPPGWHRPDNWSLSGTVELVPSDTAPLSDEISLVHLGNNSHHRWLLDRLGGPRTVVVMHDLVLHHLLVEATVGEGDDERFEKELVIAHGESGLALARARRVGVSGARDPFLFPARGAFLEGAEGVIVHSRWAERIVTAEHPKIPVAAVGLPAADPGVFDRGEQRRRLGVADDDVVLMHLGFLSPEKGLADVLTGVAAAVRAGVPARLLLVGEGGGLDDLLAAAARVGVGDRVTATGWMPPDEFLRIPAAADLGIVLRTPSAGETSAAAIRFLACGTPLAVGGTNQFLEWPESAAPRITPGPPAPAEIARILAEATSGGATWEERRRAARAAYETGHRPEDTARQMVGFLETLGP